MTLDARTPFIRIFLSNSKNAYEQPSDSCVKSKTPNVLSWGPWLRCVREQIWAGVRVMLASCASICPNPFGILNLLTPSPYHTN